MTVNWERVLTETKAFFRSGVFYILLGCIFLAKGYSLSGNLRTHSAFIFIIVILGVALILFGTGTSATGEGASGPIKVAIAGGAGVLALVLGFGVVWDRQGLVEVFKHQRDYGVLDLTLSKDSGIPVDLGSFEVNARLSNRVPLPLWNDNQTIEILVPIPDDDSKSDVFVKFTPKPGFQANYVNDAQIIPVNWDSGNIQETTGFANETIRVFHTSLEPLKPKEITVQPISDKTNAPAGNFTITPE